MMKMESLSILVIGDLHFTERSIPITNLLTPLLIKTIHERKPDLVVVLGDVLDRFGKADVQLQSSAVRFLYEVSQLAHLLLVIGNHDIPNKTMFLTGDHGFSAVKYWKNVTIADTSCVTVKVHNRIFAAVPYVPNGRFQEALETMKDVNLNDVTAIFAHQEFKGCDIKGNASVEGDVWEHHRPLIISGHIHNHQWPQPNLCYVGTPYNENFGEKEIKSISLFKFFDASFLEERIYLDVPRRVEYTCSVKEVSKWILPPNVIAKLRIVGTPAENIAAKKFPAVRSLKAQGVTIVYEDIIDTSVRDHLAIEMLNEKATPTFTDIMLNLISERDYLKGIYNEIFIE
ncbi:Calcineurin-like phosphoesterase [uncultured virus]|nr:Calcineurin-like phosphoesterase [uncultured virus]